MSDETRCSIGTREKDKMGQTSVVLDAVKLLVGDGGFATPGLSVDRDGVLWAHTAARRVGGKWVVRHYIPGEGNTLSLTRLAVGAMVSAGMPITGDGIDLLLRLAPEYACFIGDPPAPGYEDVTEWMDEDDTERVPVGV